MPSRTSRPAGVNAPSAIEAARLEAGGGGVELVVGPRPGAAVAAQRQAPVQLGEQPDLGGVEPGADPRRDVAVTTELAQLVAAPPHRRQRIVGDAEGAEPGEQRATLRPQRLDRPRQQLVGPGQALGLVAEQRGGAGRRRPRSGPG